MLKTLRSLRKRENKELPRGKNRPGRFLGLVRCFFGVVWFSAVVRVLRGLDLLVLRGFDGGSFQENRFAPRTRKSGCKSHFDLHLNGANRGAMCTSICTITSANCTWLCTIPSANCTCHLHHSKCKLHMPFALQKLDLHNKPVKLQIKLLKCKWQVRFALGMV